MAYGEEAWNNQIQGIFEHREPKSKKKCKLLNHGGGGGDQSRTRWTCISNAINLY